MTVLPLRSTNAAPTGGVTSPFLPTRVILSLSMRNAESSIGALPSPVIRRAPSKNVALLAAARCSAVGAGEEQAATVARTNSRRGLYLNGRLQFHVGRVLFFRPGLFHRESDERV